MTGEDIAHIITAIGDRDRKDREQRLEQVVADLLAALEEAANELERFTHDGPGAQEAYYSPHGKGLIVDYGPAKQMVREVKKNIRAAIAAAHQGEGT